jgi:uncharacterized protein (UPF0210 family)
MAIQFSPQEILETIRMVQMENLDIRTITMGISLRNCADSSLEAAAKKSYEKICRSAARLVAVGEEIEREYGIPIINKRVSVTPVALVAEAQRRRLRAVRGIPQRGCKVGVNFPAASRLSSQRRDARRRALSRRSEGHGARVRQRRHHKAGINMDAVALMGRTILETARLSASRDGLGCAKLVVFCNAVDDNPFMAGAFHGIGDPTA